MNSADSYLLKMKLKRPPSFLYSEIDWLILSYDIAPPDLDCEWITEKYESYMKSANLGGVGGGGVTSYIWHSTDVRAE